MDALSEDVEKELLLVHSRHRDDARQEAYLAILVNRDPLVAVACFRRDRLRDERREQATPMAIPLSFFHSSNGEETTFDVPHVESARHIALQELHELVETLDQ